MTDSMSWPEIIQSVEEQKHLSKDEARWAMREIMSGQATDDQMAAFLLGLRAKGEVLDEISGFVDVMLDNAVKVPVTNEAIDIVGTGGDQLGTVNISTMAAIVVASCGYPVLKHGSRSASGKTGSSEMLEALGIKLDLSPEQLAEVFQKTQITFFFAPLFHPSLKNVAPVRKALGVPTTFNFLGPLANPVQPIATALGVANKGIAPLIANEIKARNRSAIVFRGSDGLDELTITGPSHVWLVHQNTLTELDFDPQSLDIPLCSVADLVGGDAQENALVAKVLFAGKLGDRPAIGNIVALNAAVGMAAMELAHSRDLSEFDFQETISAKFLLAQEAIASGKTQSKMNEWVVATNNAK